VKSQLHTALLSLLLLTACAGEPKRAVLPSPSPNAVAADMSQHKGRPVEWGGVIISVENRRDSTWLELLAYPLDDAHKPRPDARPLGRFLAVHPGYLETADYAPKRWVTVVGRVQELRVGKVGQAPYRFPLVEIDRIDMWRDTKAKTSSEPQMHFGIGVGIGL
jgi:outer membrane lipoprotein